MSFPIDIRSHSSLLVLFGSAHIDIAFDKYLLYNIKHRPAFGRLMSVLKHAMIGQALLHWVESTWLREE